MKKVRRFLVFLLVIIFIYEAYITSLVLSGQNNTEVKADVLIVLGAKVWEDGPSPVFKERLDAAYDYLVDNKSATAIISGGQGEDEPISEGFSGYTYLIEKGIDANRLQYEDKSVSTIENIKFSMSKVNDSKVALVSNDYHIYRALMLGKRLGYDDLEGLSAISKTSNTFKSYIREIISLSYHYLFTRP